MKRHFGWLSVVAAIATLSAGATLANGNGPSNRPPQANQGGGNQQGHPPQGQQGLGGTISDLTKTSTGASFTLSDPRGGGFTVTTTTATAITRESDGTVVTLANNLKVRVSGQVDKTTKTVTATAIVVDDSLQGTVGNLVIAATGAAFDLTDGKGIVTSIATTTSTAVVNESNTGRAILTEGQTVRLIGAIDATTGLYTATKIVVNDRSPVACDFGKISNLATVSGVSTFTLTYKNGSTVSVATTATTKITNFSDNSVATLANGQGVFVQVAYDATTKILTATSVVVNDGKPKKTGDSASGTVASITVSSSSLSLTVTKASVTPTSTAIQVFVTSSTIIRDARGKKITLSDLTVGAKIKVGGTFDATTQTLTAVSVSVSK